MLDCFLKLSKDELDGVSNVHHSMPGERNFFLDETSKRMALGSGYDMSVYGNMRQENIKWENNSQSMKTFLNLKISNNFSKTVKSWNIIDFSSLFHILM